MTLLFWYWDALFFAFCCLSERKEMLWLQVIAALGAGFQGHRPEC
jgi:hypothetical protein